MEEKHITSLRGNYIFLKKTIGMVMTLSFTSPSPRFSPTHPPRAGDIYSLLSNIAANSLLIKYVGYILLNNILVIFYMSYLNIVRYLCPPLEGVGGGASVAWYLSWVGGTTTTEGKQSLTNNQIASLHYIPFTMTVRENIVTL
jgi:hypothetical protein